MLETVDDLVGGRWLLIQCGNFVDPHPLAGWPARALLHVALCYALPQQYTQHVAVGSESDSSAGNNTRPEVFNSSASNITSSKPDSSTSNYTSSESLSSASNNSGSRNSGSDCLRLLKEPTPYADLPPGSKPMLYFAPYELDKYGCLTGEGLGLWFGFGLRDPNPRIENPRCILTLHEQSINAPPSSTYAISSCVDRWTACVHCTCMMHAH